MPSVYCSLALTLRSPCEAPLSLSEPARLAPSSHLNPNTGLITGLLLWALSRLGVNWRRFTTDRGRRGSTAGLVVRLIRFVCIGTTLGLRLRTTTGRAKLDAGSPHSCKRGIERGEAPRLLRSSQRSTHGFIQSSARRGRQHNRLEE